MEIIFLLIPLALLMLGVAVAAFIWAVKTDQFEDLEREAQRILFDEDQPQVDPTSPPNKKPPSHD